jgi:hypothetical protein
VVDSRIDKTSGRRRTEGGENAIGCFLTAFWMAIGNLVLAVVLMDIWRDGGRFAVSRETTYWTTLVLLVAARLVDIRWYSGETLSGEPASMPQFWRYAIGLVIVASTLWVAAHWRGLVG